MAICGPIMKELAFLDATAQAELVRAQVLSPLELVEHAITRIVAVNPQLNAVISPRFESGRAEAVSARLPDGPFRGVPFLLKDLDAYSAGDPYHCGIYALKRAGWKADRDSHLAAKFRRAGLISLGKTNTPELGLAVTTEPAAYGVTRNPWNPAHSTGGSSGGSAAAVASGMVPAAHASDGGGSIRIPASECGLVGLKPSRGRVSLGPDYGEYWAGLVISSVVTRSIRDTAAMLDAICEPMPGDPYVAPTPARPFRAEVGEDPGSLRVGVLRNLVAFEIHEDCRQAAEVARVALERLGHRVEESQPAALDDSDFTQHLLNVVTSWTAASLDEWGLKLGRPLGPEDVEPPTWAATEIGRAITAAQYVAALEALSRYTRRMASWWAEGFDVLVTPTIAVPPPLLGELAATTEDPLGLIKSLPVVPFTAPFNVTGQPAISLPLHWNRAGLPIGVQLVAAYGREDVLLRLAAQLERALPWSDRLPPIHA
jgi:amidase